MDGHWLDSENGYRIYLVEDNAEMMHFFDHVQEDDKNEIRLSSDENLGIHYYDNKLHASNYVGICRIHKANGDTLQDKDGNTLLIKVIPRFMNTRITELLNYIRDDDEFDRYLTPQTDSNKKQKAVLKDAIDNEVFTFFDDELPIKINDEISNETSIITVTVFLHLLQMLCRKPLMGRMLKTDNNLVGKVKGKIVIEKNISTNTIHGRNDRFYCSYLHYTDDIKENQILKAAFRIAKRFVNDYLSAVELNTSMYTRMISYCTNSLKHISDISCKSEDCVGLKFSGCYVNYKPVMVLAKMVLESISIDHTGAASSSGYTIPYAISMDRLFEIYVRAYLKKHGIHSYKSITNEGIRLEEYDKKIDVFSDGAPKRNLHISGPIKPDIILTDIKTSKQTVFDIKYKNLGSGGREDRLQVLAYSMLLNADDVGIILPSSDDNDEYIFERIQSEEDRDVIYHQIKLAFMKKGVEPTNMAARKIKHIIDEKPTAKEKRILIQYKISSLQKKYNDLLSLMKNKNTNETESKEVNLINEHIAELEILKKKYEKGNNYK